MPAENINTRNEQNFGQSEQNNLPPAPFENDTFRENGSSATFDNLGKLGEISEKLEVDRERAQRELGAKTLSAAGFNDRNNKIVESSFDKARANKEKLPGKNAERRSYAYISRLENLINQYGNEAEKKLWHASVDKLVIDPKNIPESYWRTQEQILRDNGQGRELNNTEKEYLIEDIQKQQRESLRSWSDYLGDKNSPYPTWFKIYAWDGMSKMGVFDANKKRYTKRDKTSVAPYPKLNPAALAKVHGAIADFYDQPDKNRYAENEERDAEMDALVQSGNFNKLYSKMMLDVKTVVKTPERTEDIKGEWIEYLPGHEEELAEAAEGTPWCVADPGTGRNYLEYGNSGGIDDNYDDNNYDNHENRAKFILFHLNNPETNNLATNACASIRLDPDGNVAEISGLKEGQALEDSLVPIVEEKVKSLPGGEKFLEAFADKQELIKLDRKMQNGEDLTKEELEFIWEVNRPIKTLDTYKCHDPRIDELKEIYGIEYTLNAGVNGDKLVSRLDPLDIVNNFETLRACGVIDIDELVSKLNSRSTERLYKALINCGADVNKLIDNFEQDTLIYPSKLKMFIDDGADINVIANKLGLDDSENVAISLCEESFNAEGGNERLSRDANDQSYYADYDLAREELASRIKTQLDIVCKIDDKTIINDIDKLNHILNPNNRPFESRIINQAVFDYVNKNFEVLISKDVDVNKIVEYLDGDIARDNLGMLLNVGVNEDTILETLGYIDKNEDYIAESLLEHGAEMDKVVSHLGPHWCDHLDFLLAHNVDIDKLINNESDPQPQQIRRILEACTEHGVKINIVPLLEKMQEIQRQNEKNPHRMNDNYIYESCGMLGNGIGESYLKKLIDDGADIESLSKSSLLFSPKAREFLDESAAKKKQLYQRLVNSLAP